MHQINYQNFDLLIEKSGDLYVARVLDSPAGEARTDFKPPFAPFELENFCLKIGRPRQGVRRADSPEMAAVTAFGKKLFSAVFKDEVLAAFYKSYGRVESQRQGLRLRLRLQAPELAEMPWEFLYNPGYGQFLVLQHQTSLVRYLEIPRPIRTLSVKPPLDILVMLANPAETEQLDVEGEWQKLNAALKSQIENGEVRLHRLKRATMRELRQTLRSGRFHIFHFIGHGFFDSGTRDGVLLFEDGQRVNGQRLGTLLQNHYSLRLAVLNACEGARTAPDDPFAGMSASLVRQGVPAVIAMQFEITDDAAIEFAREFYNAVALGFPVDAALAEARIGIFSDGNDMEWGTPVLHMRAPDGRIFSVQEKTAILNAERAKDAEKKEKTAALLRDLEQALKDEKWGSVKTLAQSVLAIEPGHARAKNLLAKAEQEQLLTQLYAKARAHFEDRHWREAVDACHAVLNKRHNYKDAPSLLKQAEKKLAEARTQEMLGVHYRQAQSHLKIKDWASAINDLERIIQYQPDYRDASALLNHAQKQFDDEQAARRREAEPRVEPEVPQTAQTASRTPLWAVLALAAFSLTIYIISQMNSQPDFETQQPTRTPERTQPQLSVIDNPDRAEKLGITWVDVPGGTFKMGDLWGDGDGDEKPVHQVKLSAFRMSKHEITNAQFSVFLNEKGNREEGGAAWLEIDSEYCLIENRSGKFAPKRGSENHPVVEVSWFGAKAFAEWLGARLPTEAEWEYAARAGGKEIKWPNGNSLTNNDANISGTGGRDQWDRTAPVGSFPANALGLHDMAGNVWEWCADWKGDYSSNAQTDPLGPAQGTYKVVRGGSWVNYVRSARSTYRDRTRPHVRYVNLGFRVVLSRRQ